MLFIVAHEFRRLFATPVAWVIMASLQVLGSLFFHVLLSSYMDNPVLQQKRGLTETVVASFMHIGCVLLVLITPIVTMRTFSERRSGTLNLLLSSPLRLLALVVGKYLAIVLFYCVLSGLLLLFPLTLLPFQILDGGQLASALIGQMAMVMSVIAIGLFVSVLCETQFGAAVGTFAILLLLWIVELAAVHSQGVLSWLSLFGHYSLLRDGLFNSEDLAYYLLTTLLFLSLSVWCLDVQRLRGYHRYLYQFNSLFTLGLILLLFALLGWFSSQYRTQYDWTRASRHTLAEASVALLAQLPETLRISSYSREDPELRRVLRRFVARYQRHKQNIRLEFINPDSAPDEVRNLGIRSDGELILRYQGRVEHVRRLREQDFSNALQRLLQRREYWLAFVEGHGEASLLGDRDYDYGAWADQLVAKGFQVQPLNLMVTRVIPDNTSVLVLGHGHTEYLPVEVELLADYLQRGGNLLWLLDPSTKPKPFTLTDLLGIWVEPGAIVDPAMESPAVLQIDPTRYPAHPVLKGLAATVFPTVAFLQHQTLPGSLDWDAQPLLLSPDRTWNETEALEHPAALDPHGDAAGPLSFGISLERTLTGTEGRPGKSQRVIIIGDDDFLSNAFLGNGGNLDLGMRIVHWLNQEEDLLRIPARTASDIGAELLSPRSLALRGLFFLFLSPVLLVSAGLFIHLRRKRR